MARYSSWKGYLKISLVSIPVKAYTASRSSGAKVREPSRVWLRIVLYEKDRFFQFRAAVLRPFVLKSRPQCL